MSGARSAIFILDALDDVPKVLRAAFTHPWVESYEIGFGPPLVRANAKLMAAVAKAKGSLEKLDAYVDCCILDRQECVRLAQRLKQIVSITKGSVEAEEVDRASTDALDLQVRLHDPRRAPDSVKASMATAMIDIFSEREHPEARLARFWVRLADPRNTRLLHRDEVRVVGIGTAALELRVPVSESDLFAPYCQKVAEVVGAKFVMLEEVPSHAMVGRDGKRT